MRREEVGESKGARRNGESLPTGNNGDSLANEGSEGSSSQIGHLNESEPS